MIICFHDNSNYFQLTVKTYTFRISLRKILWRCQRNFQLGIAKGVNVLNWVFKLLFGGWRKWNICDTFAASVQKRPWRVYFNNVLKTTKTFFLTSYQESSLSYLEVIHKCRSNIYFYFKLHTQHVYSHHKKKLIWVFICL